jgi:hypothetical protein
VSAENKQLKSGIWALKSTKRTLKDEKAQFDKDEDVGEWQNE